MFSHVMIGTNDLEKSRAFYDALLGTLGVPAGALDRYRVFWRTPTGVFSVTTPDRKSTRLNSSHSQQSRMPSSA